MNHYFSFTEIIGYLASVTVLISFLMRDIRKLRMVNCLGCALFVFYGVLLNSSIPIIFTNTVIFMVNIYYLLKPIRKPVIK